MTQRISGLKDEEADVLGREIIDSCTHLLGRAANSTRILAKHSPYVSRWFLGFVASLRQPDLGASTEPRLRALATIKTSMINECAYCTSHTSLYGEALGLTSAELEEMQSDAWKESASFSERDKAVVAWSEAMTQNTARQDADLWAEMKRLFTESEIVEISMCCGLFNLLNRFNDSLWVDLESEDFNRRQGRAVSGVSVEDVEAYAGRFPGVGEASRRQAAE
jgi:alkylhydroperoxidase family enzyme